MQKLVQGARGVANAIGDIFSGIMKPLFSAQPLDISGIEPQDNNHEIDFVGLDVWNTTALIRPYPVEPLVDVGKAMKLPLDKDPVLKERWINWANACSIKEPRAFLEEGGRKFNTTVPDDAVEKLKDVIRIEHNAFAWYRDVEPFLKAMKDNNIPVGLLSDTWTFTGPLLKENVGISKECAVDEGAELKEQLLPKMSGYIQNKHVVLSCDAGITKPAQALFETFAGRFEKPCKKGLYVGDNVIKDVLGARKAGYYAVLLDRTGSVSRENKLKLRSLGIPCVNSLFELQQLLQTLNVIR